MSHLLLLFIIPFASALIAFAIPATSRRVALVLSLLPLALLLYGHTHWIGSEVDYTWLPSLAIHFHLSIDSLSLVFLYLTAVIIPVSLFAVPRENLSHGNVFYGLVLMLQGLLIAFFTIRDLAFFTLFWEAMLIPLYFIIASWGGPKSQSAAMKFIIYMIAGSTLMVAAVLLLFLGAHSFNFDALAKTAQNLPSTGWIFAIFCLAFAVKTPLFPFHAWLPDAYCQAPTTGTILLSGILSKAGIYGFLRIGLEFFPDLIKEWSPLLVGLAIAGVFYAGLAAWMQRDFKRLIAYSSLAHVNFILVGVFAWSQVAHTGAILQSVNHGITIAALFLVASWLELRLGNTHMGQASGVAKYFPQLCWVTLFFVVASVALPGTNNFVGELLILVGLFALKPWTAAFLALTVVVSVIYMLRWMQKVYFEEPTPEQRSYVDIKGKELLYALPLILLILWIGIYPAPILNLIQQQAANPIAALDTLKEIQ